MGRRPVAEGVKQEPELGLRLLGTDPQDGEDPLLDLPPVDPHAARAQLPPVQDKVVGPGPDVEQVATFQGVKVLLVRHGERMVGRNRVPRVVQALEQREVHHPQEVETALSDRRAAQLQADQTQDVADGAALVGHDEEQVADLGLQGGAQSIDLLVGQELSHWGIDAAVLHLHPDQAFGPPLLALLGQVVQPVSGQIGAARHPDALHTGGLEGPETGVGEHPGQFDQLHSEPDVGLIGSETLHGLVPRHPGYLPRALAGNRFGGRRDGIRDEGQHVVLGDETGFGVELHELELAVGPEVLVAQTAGDLVVAVHTADHAELLEDLRALGQGVEGTRFLTGRDHEVACTLGRAGDQHRGLDLDEPLLLHGLADGAVHPSPDLQVALHPGPAQVHVPVAEPQHLVHVNTVVQGEGWRLGGRQDGHVGGVDLHGTGGQAVVSGVGWALAHRSGDLQDILATQVVRSVDDQLHHSAAVPQVDESQMFAVFPASVDPAAEGDLAAHVANP